jgi:DNA-binding NtrC family response regulator
MNGRELAARAQEVRPLLKVLFTTAYARIATIDDGMLDSYTTLLPKPFTAVALAHKVAEVLSAGTSNATQDRPS